MARSPFLVQQAVLDLVASDFSYKPTAAIGEGPNGDKLKSYPDNKPGDEVSFPRLLLDNLDQSLASPYHALPVSSTPPLIYEFDNWHVAKTFNDDGDGYGAVVFKSKFVDPETQKYNYIVAFRGTDGLNSQDWFANLDLAKNVWVRQRDKVMSYLLGTAQAERVDQATLGHISFTGQSLGGGLAQYAAYTYAVERDTEFRADSISLITFNGFGGVRGLKEIYGTYNPKLLKSVQTAHFVIDNDIVHRLGAGAATDLAAVGGSWHVNGTGNTYQFEVKQKTGTGFAKSESGRVLKLGLVEAHRTESGFYYGLGSGQATFGGADPISIKYLDTQNSQSIAVAMSRVMNKGLTTEATAKSRLIVGLVALGIAGKRSEIRTFSRALLDSYYASTDDIGTGWKAALELLGLPETIRVLAQRAKNSAIASGVLAIAVEAFDIDSSQKPEIWTGINSFLLPAKQFSAPPPFTLPPTRREPEKGFMLFMSSLELFSTLPDADIDELVIDSKQRAFVDNLKKVTLDPQQILDTYASGDDWLRKSMAYLQRAAAASDVTGEALATFDLALVDFLKAQTPTAGAGDSAFQDYIHAAALDFLQKDFGYALANARIDFTKPYQLASATVFPTQLDFVNYDRIHDALEAASKDPKYSAIRDLIEKALEAVEVAGETVVITHAGPNPFETSTFNPDTAAAPSSTIAEGGARHYNLALPYEAGAQGQKVKLSFAGDAANVVRVIEDGQERTTIGGSITFTVEPGQRQKSFTILTRGDIDADETIVVSATLVDAAGVPTHKTSVELNLHLNARKETTTTAAGPAGTDKSDYLAAAAGGSFIDAKGGYDHVAGGAGNDRIRGGDGRDYIRGGLGNNWLEGNAGRDVIILGSGEDYADGGADGDFISYFGKDLYPVSLEKRGGAAETIGLAWSWGFTAGATTTGDLGLLTFSAGLSGPTPVQNFVVAATYGPAAGQEIHGGGGHDFINAGPGDDVIFGDGGTDAPVAGGNPGSDTGSNGTSTGGTGTPPGGTSSTSRRLDTYGTRYFDSNPMFGAGGAAAGANYAAGNDFIVAGAGNDTAFGQDGDDNLAGGDGADYLDGGLKNDNVYGEAGDDFVYGGDGRDLVMGDSLWIAGARHGADVVDGGPGDDALIGGGGSDTLYGGAGNDWLDGDWEELAVAFHGDDYLDGGNGDDMLGGGGGKDTLYGGAGMDVLHGDSPLIPLANQGDDWLDGEAGNDFLYGYAGNDSLFGGTEKDQLSGDAGDDWLSGEDDDDLLFGGDGKDTLFGGSGMDELSGEAGDDTLQGGDGNDLVWGQEGIDALYGGAGSDQLVAGAGDDQVFGGLDTDFMWGEDGNDTLTGGAGADALYGGAGNDTYVFATGDGADTISDTQGVNRIRFRDAVAADQLTIVRGTGGANFLIEYSAGDTITIVDAVGGAIRDFEFADGTVVTAAQLFKNPPLPTVNGTPGDDSMLGSAQDDEILGGYGSDSISAGAGNDVIEGGPDDDYSLHGEAGSDTYRFKRGSGLDVIDEWPTFGEHNIVVMGADILPDDVTVTSPSFGVVTLALANGVDRVVIQGWYGEGTLGESFERPVSATSIDEVRFANGVVWDQNTLVTKLNVVTAGGGRLFGMAGDDVMSGLGGDDWIAANAGDDTLSGDGGVDQLWGGRGFDVLLGGTGKDLLEGGDDADVLDGGSDEDTLSGGNGDDVYVFAPGYGTDIVRELGPVTDTDTLAFAAGVLPRDVFAIPLSYDPTHLEVWFSDTADRIVLDYENGTTPIERVIFDDGTVWTHADVQWLAPTPGAGGGDGTVTNASDLIHGTSIADIYDALGGNDYVYGYAGNDLLKGGAGDDQLTGDAGDDVLDGGAGSDCLYGVTGNDTMTGGADSDFLNGGYGADTLDGGTGADTMLGGPGNDVYIVDNAGDVVSERNGGGKDVVRASVSHVLPTDVENLVLTGTLSINGTGNALSNSIIGNSANNALSGGAGNDRLDGGPGFDTLSGGAGNDTFFVDETWDVVTENANEGTDLVQSTATYTLPTNVENLTLTGPNAVDATGNAGANVINGNSAANVLDGGGGADTLSGGAGDDTYVLDVAGDSVTEAANAGIDAIRSPFTYTLGANLENLTLTGTAIVGGTGNAAGNVIVGNAAANTLTGLAGNDTLDGGAGVDSMSGGVGDDTYVVDNAGDVVTEAANAGIDTVRSAITYALRNNVENLVLTGTAAIGGTGNAIDNVVTGNAANNMLNGGAGNDTLNGGQGADALAGGAGNDTYEVDDPGDAVTEIAGEGSDTVRSAIAWTLGANLENLALIGTAAVNGTGNALDNVLTGNAAANTLAGLAGNDTYVIDSDADVVKESAGEGTDLVMSAVTYTLTSNVERLTLTGTAAANATGNTLANTLRGNSAANVLDGAAGADDMAGGAGDDTYRVDNSGDLVTENANQGTDTVRSAVTWTLGLNVERLTLSGAAAINGTGNAGNNTLTGNAAANNLRGLAGNDTLNGGAGADSMAGGAGDDTYYVDNTGDAAAELTNEGVDTVYSYVTYTLGNNVERLILIGLTPIDGTGNALDNVLNGNNALNRLAGGTGNDTYVIDNATDIVVENANEGLDTVQTYVTYTLPSNVERLLLLGAATMNGTGNALDNTLYANSAANTLAGLAGNDTYIVDSAADIIVENVNEGVDEVRSAANYVLGANVENLTLTGAAASGTGNSLANVLQGNAAANLLDGGANADIMKGGAGDDAYAVDHSGDLVVENVNEGMDEVRSSATYTLSANVEKLTLTGTAAVNGTGNALDNVLTGNSAVNTLAGRAGNDVYNVDNTADVIVENANEGTDEARSSVNYTLSANVEKLTLTGSAAINGTGNANDNVLTGNSAANKLAGLAGNDIYIVDNTVDVIIENANEGADEVRSSVTYTLSANVETLTLTGFAAIKGTGNTLDNTLVGNGANNTLNGGAGNDVMDGLAGADTMIGGAGNDIYMLDSASDTVTENANEGTDTVKTAFSYTLGANVENLRLLGSSAINGSGNALDNAITGNGAANTLTGDAGNDRLNGGAGADTMAGGTGNDKYIVDAAGDVVTEKFNEGIDTVEASITYVLGSHVENLTLTGTVSLKGTGNAFVNVIRGNSGDNVLDGGAGGDSLAGGAGNDTYWLDSLADSVTENASEGTDSVNTPLTHTLSANVENLTLTGSAAVNGTGNALNNVITGNSASNVLAGGAGDDTYYLTSNDVVVENAGEGTDTVMSPVTHALEANIENLTLTNGLNKFDALKAHYIALWGQAQWDAHSGTSMYGEYVSLNPHEDWRLSFTDALGNTLNNTLEGDSQDNWLEGGAGNDTLRGGAGADLYIGGAGDDTYYIDDADYSLGGSSAYVWSNLFGRKFTQYPPLAEESNGGTDTVVTTSSYSLAANFENLTLTGTAAINGSGSNGANLILGNEAANRIDGGGGADTMRGGAGNDTYVVDHTGDIVTEKANEGVDTVESYVTYILGATLEHLTLVGDAEVDGTGNTLDNALKGNIAANVLNGGTGADAMAGGQGDDAYVVDNAGDTVTENVGEGNDTVRVGFTYALGANVENLTLTGTAAINGTGNVLDNTLTGNAAVNALAGLTGNDTYVVDGTADVIVEKTGEGTDTVRSSVTYTLGANLENLTLTGATAINGTGNTLDNVLIGNIAVNMLAGLAGNDTYVVDNAADVVTEQVGAGTDTVRSSAPTYTLSSNVEHLWLIGTGLNAVGNTLANTLTGNELDNLLDGRAGTDTMAGGLGDDTYVVDVLTDVVTENAFEGTDTVRTGITYTLGPNIENLMLTGMAAVNGAGNALDNVLTGNAAVNTLAGRAGNDTYVVDSTVDVISELAGEGSDTVRSSVTYVLGANLENLTLTGTAAVNGTGNTLANILTGNAAVNTLAGLTGNDTYVVDNTIDAIVENANAGTDTVQSSVTYTLGANVENLTLTGTAVINGTGNALDNVLTGNAAMNTLAGLTGNDVYIVDGTIDVIVENANEGTDEVRSSVSYTLGPNLEKLTLIGNTWTALAATGNDEANTLTGTVRGDILDGRGGADTMAGGSGNDAYYVDNSNDVVTETSGVDTVYSTVTYALAANVEHLTLIGAGAIDGTGNTLDNQITGNAAANTLTGGAGNDSLYGGNGGADRLIGGIGDDRYSIDGTDDSVIELAGEGVDSVVSSLAAYTLPANVENGGAATYGNYDLTGNALDNRLFGGQGDNVLDGGAGADYMEGGEGNDTYILDNAGDVVFELAWDSSIDTIVASFSYALAEALENLTLIGGAAANGTGNEGDNELRGNSGANILTGLAGDDLLDGGLGGDTLEGGLDDDTYVIDSAADVVTELENEGMDTVESFVTHTLGANFENLALLGASAIDGTGNAVGNWITGNGAANKLTGGDGDDVLDGGAGIDTLVGGAGNDLYKVDNAADVVTEASGVDVDTVESVAPSYTLAANVENLTLAGTGAISGTGNGLDNTLTGNSAANVLNGAAGNDTIDGGGGADAMAGGPGNDIYRVDNTADAIAEAAGADIDVVFSTATYTLAANIERLTLTGSAAIDGTGNADRNTLEGNAADNALSGNEGVDWMYGGKGNDLMNGGAGNDNIFGEDGRDVLQGMDGNESLVGGQGNDALLGGAGADTLTSDTGLSIIGGEVGENDFLAGGWGDDYNRTGRGADVIAFNRGDGRDTVDISTGADNTLSLGGAIGYADMSFTKSGDKLIFNLGGAGDSVTFDDWYSNIGNYKSVLNMQVIAAALADFDATSSDPLRNRRVANFDFLGLANAFDNAGAPTNWKLTDTLLTQHLRSTSDTAALGADLAYRYGRYGSLAGIGFDPVQGMLASGSFGVSAQALQSDAALMTGAKRLA